jgi:predicted AAA+ superfamily ATPase
VADLDGQGRREVFEGGLPPAALAARPDDRQSWFEGYVDTYLRRDLRDLTQVGDLAAFSRLMRLAALRSGGLVNQADLARDAAVSRATAARWLSLLGASFIVTLLPAFAESRAKRLIKTPKLYLLDTGLALHLAGISSHEDLAHARTGTALEHLVLNDLLAWRETELRKPEVFYRRTASGEEVDFVVERGRRLLPIELKAGRSLRTADARALEEFCSEYDRRAPLGIILYGGTEAELLTRRVVAVPLERAL